MFQESAKLCALRAHVPTCLACLWTHVPTFVVCLQAHVLTCLTYLRAHVSTILSTLFTNNKRTISWHFGTVASTTQLGFYLFKVNNRNTKNARARCEMCLKIIVRTPEQRQWHQSGAFIVNFQHISHIQLVFPLVTLSK